MGAARIPERIGRYRIVRALSKGGMALVYEGRRDTQIGVSPRVAIKVILPDFATSSTYRDLFVNEARIGAAMHHQNLVQILDFDAEDDRYFLVMEYVDGFTLSRIAALASRHDVRLPLAAICEIGRQACDGLHYAHEAVDPDGRPLSMVHRDIKPSNLILTPEGAVKILDFGISRGRLRHERQGAVKGTWGYMSPEQATAKRLQPNADVFSLGIVLYELAARRPMFRELQQDEIRDLLLDDHPARIVPTLDPAYAPLMPVLDRALRQDPLERFTTAAEFGRHLHDLMPDPHTTREELIALYRTMHELHEAERRRHAPSRSPSQATVPAPTRAEAVVGRPVADDTPQAMVTAAAVGMVVVVGAFLAGAGLVDLVSSWGADASATDAAIDRPRPVPMDDPVADDPPGDASPPAPAPDAPDPVAEQTARLRVRAVQDADVYVDGRLVVGTDGIEVAPGRHVISLVARDGRRTSLEVRVEAGQTLKRTWDFDRLAWR